MNLKHLSSIQKYYDIDTAVKYSELLLSNLKYIEKVVNKDNLSKKERADKTKKNRKFEDGGTLINSDECYTFYQYVEKIVNHFGLDYWKNKVVYMNCDDVGKSAFWIYFYNNFEKLGLKKIIATCLSEYVKPIIKYDGIKITTKDFIESIGSYSDKECMNIATNEADVIITNPPFSCWEHYYRSMLSTNKDIICLGAGSVIRYKLTDGLWKSGKLYVLPIRFDWFLTPTYKLKNALSFVYTNVKQSHILYKTLPLSKIPVQYYDDAGILVVDKYIPNDYYKPFCVSINPVKYGLLNADYKLLQCGYNPYKDGMPKFGRNIVVRTLDENGKPNTQYDNIVYKTVKPIKVK